MHLNNQIIEYWYIVQEYLNKETDYAIAVEGQEQMGKSYFLKEILPIKIDSNAPYSNYKTVYISLFAVKTIEELKSKIKNAIYPIAQKYFLSIAKNDANKFRKGIAIFSNFGFNPFDIVAQLSAIRPEISKMSAVFEENYDNIVLCFDDLEKRYPYFEFSEIIAFVNDLVQTNTKVLLAMNRGQMSDFDNDNTIKVYNKIFPFQLNFNFYQEQIYEAIVMNSYSNNNVEFGDYLLKYEATILRILNTLEHFVPMSIFRMLLNQLEKLHTYLQVFFLENEAANEYHEDILQAIINLLIHRFLGKEYTATWAQNLDIELQINFFETIVLDMLIVEEKEAMIYDLITAIYENIKASFQLNFLSLDLLEN